MSEAKRLHPAAIIFNFIRSLREAIFLIIFGYLTFSDTYFLYFILGGVALLLVLIATSVLSWYRFTYRVEEEELRIEYGVLVRKKRYISKNRIQSIDLTSGVLHRLLKLTKVNIETAGSGTDAEASLKAVKLAEGERLRSELKKGAGQETVEAQTEEDEEVVPQDQPTFKITFKRLFIAGTTSGSIGVVFAAFAFFFSQFEQFIPDEVYDTTMNWVIGLGIALMIGLAILVLLVLWLLGIAGTMIKYGNFTIVRNKDELFITRGLLEKKQLTIPLNRIQAVGVQESLIRQPLGFATVFAEVAGGSMDKGEDFSTVLFPIMKKEEVEGFLQELMPDYADQEEPFKPLPKRALKIYLGYATWPLLFVGAAVLYFIPQFFWAVLILIAVFLFLGYLQYKDAGFRVEGKRLSIRHRTFGRMTVNIYHRRMQAFEKKQHKLQKLQRLASMKVSIISKFGAGKHYKLTQLEEEDVDSLGDWYSYRKENEVPGSSAE